MKKNYGIRWTICLALLAMASACAPSTNPVPPQDRGVVKLGKPYVIDGKQYYPSYDPEYDKIGEASWYGPGFHGKRTANGEEFNENDMTAAHTTLPMPSFVRVTNLENGKSIMVRVNDRGPFHSNRIIDLSSRAAEELGVKARGTAQVRVQYLKKESDEYIAMLKGESPVLAADTESEPVSRDDSEETQIGNPAGDQLMENRAVGAAAPVAMVASNDLAPIGGLSSLSPAANATPAPAFSSPSPPTYASAPMTPSIDGSSLPATLPPSQARPEAQASIGATPDPVVQQMQMASAQPASVAPPTNPAPAIAGGAGWFVQAGAFSMRDNAQKLQRQLEPLGPTQMSEIAVGGKTWYRVRLGPIADRAAAEQKLGSVSALGLPDAKIVRN